MRRKWWAFNKKSNGVENCSSAWTQIYEDRNASLAIHPSIRPFWALTGGGNNAVSVETPWTLRRNKWTFCHQSWCVGSRKKRAAWGAKPRIFKISEWLLSHVWWRCGCALINVASFNERRWHTSVHALALIFIIIIDPVRFISPPTEVNG